ncbi:MAG: hypothetical protein MUC91_04715 [Verrucomicrobia bacterium]|nr:hypothetical protein [Verrucomicrobiota bacterium]
MKSLLNLPQCYLADLPEEAEHTPALVTEAWLAVQRNRERHLAPMGTDVVIRVVAGAAQLWLEADSPFMRAALEFGPQELGFSRQTLEAGLRELFGSLTAPQLEAWIEQDLGHPRRLDEFCASAVERGSRRRSRAVGPRTLAHVTAGNIPASAVLSLTAGLLVRSAQFVKCATARSLIPRLYAHSIREVSTPLASCLELAEWPGKREDLLLALIDPAECVTATGTDAAVAAVRQHVPVNKRFVGHGHKVSLAYVAKEDLTAGSLPQLIEALAGDVCAWDQLGCLSPHVIYVEAGGAIGAERVAAGLAEALARMEETYPRGPLPEKQAANIRSRRSLYEIRAAHSEETRLWQSPASTAWTVVYESNPRFQTSCLNRFIYVKDVADLEAALQGADDVRGRVSTVALAASGARAPELARGLADWGVHRICPVGAMQKPPVLWRHDGRPALGELVRWTDLEEP